MPQVDAHRLSHVERNSLAFKDERAIFVQSCLISKVPWFYTSSLFGLAPKDTSFTVGSIQVAFMSVISSHIYMF